MNPTPPWQNDLDRLMTATGQEHTGALVAILKRQFHNLATLNTAVVNLRSQLSEVQHDIQALADQAQQPQNDKAMLLERIIALAERLD